MDLCEAILSRRSVRRYRDESLDKNTLGLIDDIVDHVSPLVPENRFRVLRRDVVSGEDLIAAMGGYGRILTPPHYLVGNAIGSKWPLVDLGYRMEQIAVQMVQLGISTCFIGSLGREENVRIRFRLNRGSRFGAFLIFGRAAEGVTGRTINAVIRRASGGANKQAVSDVFYNGSFKSAGVPPKSLARIIDAGHAAPSANSVQPWRFLRRDDTLYLFLRRRNSRYGSKPALQEYRYFDAGACMANVMMAMESTDLLGDWMLLEEGQPDVPAYPAELEPLAKLRLR